MALVGYARVISVGQSLDIQLDKLIELKQRRENGDLVKDLMTDYGISKATLYRYFSES